MDVTPPFQKNVSENQFDKLVLINLERNDKATKNLLMEEQDEEDMQLRKDFSQGGLSWMRPSGIVSELPTGR